MCNLPGMKRANLLLPWQVYRCELADRDGAADRACGIRIAGSSDPYERDFVVHDTNCDECCHGMQLADAEHIVRLHNESLSKAAP